MRRLRTLLVALVTLAACVATAAFLGTSTASAAPAPSAAALAQSRAADVPSNYGTIGNYHSGKCLDDTNGGGYRTQQQIWTCLYNSHQEWRIEYERADGAIDIENELTGGCLDLSGGSASNGAHVILYACNNGDDAQLWYLLDTDITGWYNLVNVASRTCMTVSADSQANGAKVQGWSCATAQTDHAYFWEPHF